MGTLWYMQCAVQREEKRRTFPCGGSGITFFSILVLFCGYNFYIFQAAAVLSLARAIWPLVLAACREPVIYAL